MCSSFRKVLTVLFLLYYTGLTESQEASVMVKIVPATLVENRCHRVEVNLLTDGKRHLEAKRSKYDSVNRDFEERRTLFTYVITTNFLRWYYVTKSEEFTFGWVIQKVNFPFMRVDVRRRESADVKVLKDYIFHPAVINNFTLELFRKNKKIENIVPINEEITLAVKYLWQVDLEPEYMFTTYWYENCELLDTIERSYIKHTFTKPFIALEIAVAIEMLFNGQTTENSPYNCEAQRLTPPPGYTPQTMVPPDGEKLFTCKENDDLFSARASTLMSIMAIDPSDFKDGEITLLQDGVARDQFVTTKDEVTITFEMKGEDAARFQQSANNSIFWYGNCVLLNQTTDNSIQYTFSVHEPYEIVAVVLAFYDGIVMEPNPYDCVNNRLQLKDSYVCASGVFRKSFNVRETKIEEGELSITQKGKLRQRIVSVHDPSILAVELEGKAAADFGKAESRTFWVQDCKVLGKSPDKKFKHIFTRAETEYKMSAVIVVSHDGTFPETIPFDCEAGLVLTDMNHAMGVFHKVYYTRDLWIPKGEVELVQNKMTRQYYVVQEEAFNLSLTYDAKGYSILNRTTDVTLYWFVDCEWLGSTLQDLFEYSFEKPFQRYKVVGVVVGLYNGTPPIAPPYDCASNTIQDDVTRAVGAFEGIYFSRVSRFQSKYGEVSLKQGSEVRHDIVSPYDAFSLSIQLSSIYGTVFQNTISKQTFWYRNCTLIGSSLKTSFESIFNEAFQTYKIVGILVTMYDGPPLTNAPYNCSNNTLKEDINYAVGVFDSVYFTRVITFNETDGKVILTQSGLVRSKFVDIEGSFNLNIKLDEKYDDTTRRALKRKTFWYSNCNYLGETANSSLKHKWNEAFQKYDITGVLVLTHSGAPPSDEKALHYNCQTKKLHVNEDFSMGAFRNTYITRATKLDNGPIIIIQKGVTRSVSVATDHFNMKLELTPAHERAMQHGKSVRIFWHRNCTLIGVSTRPRAVAIFRKPYRAHELVAVIVAVHEGPPPKISPYICATKKVKLDIKYTMAAFFATITTKDPIRNVNIEGDRDIRDSEILALKGSFTGSPPYEFCVWVFEEPTESSYKEDCHTGGFKFLHNEATRIMNNEPIKTNDNIFEYVKKFEAGKKLLQFIIKNEVSKEIIPVHVNVYPVLLANLKCLGGCN